MRQLLHLADEVIETKTGTRSDLAEPIFRKIGLSRTEFAQLVEMVLEGTCSAVVAGDIVSLSTFGTFQVREKRKSRALSRTGEEVPISRRQVVTFKASDILKDRVLLVHRERKGKKQAVALERFDEPLTC